MAENDHSPLTWHIALTTVYALTCYTVIILALREANPRISAPVYLRKPWTIIRTVVVMFLHVSLTSPIIGSCSVKCLMMALMSVSLLYWHIGILINLTVYDGLILYQIASTREMAPQKVACCHLQCSIVISGIS